MDPGPVQLVQEVLDHQLDRRALRRVLAPGLRALRPHQVHEGEVMRRKVGRQELQDIHEHGEADADGDDGPNHAQKYNILRVRYIK